MIPQREHLLAAGIRQPDQWLAAVQAVCAEFGIDTAKRIAAFLAQTAHESNGYTALEENLNYRATTLATCWPSRFAEPKPGAAAGKFVPLKDAKGVNVPNKFAQTLERHPQQIANVVYGGRMGNGPTQSGDGWKYRGRGLKQLTGHDNYQQCGKALQLDLLSQPDLLLQPQAAARSAGWFWSARGCAAFIDRDDFEGLTRRINGGVIGLDARRKRYEAVLATMPA